MVICDRLTDEDRYALLTRLFGKTGLLLLADSVNCLFRHPEEWGCAEDGVQLFRFLAEFDDFGCTSVKAQYDPLQNAQLFSDCFACAIRREFASEK